MHRHALTWVFIFGVITLMFLRLPPMVAMQDSVVNTYSALVEVDALAKRHFVESIHDERLVDGAIRGMMLQLDPYSGYIAPEELPAFERRSDGDYTGVGLELGVENGRITVIAPIEGSPAAHDDVRPGDILLAVNGREVDGRSVFEVEDWLVGRPGSVVKLRLLHPGDDEPVIRSTRRDHVIIRTVRGFRRAPDGTWDYWIDHGARIGYIRVSNFRHNTTRDFDDALASLGSGGLRGLVLDLRFNPGGIMQQGIDMVDRFVSDGVILSTVTRRRAVEEFRADPDMAVGDIPLAVLTNGSSASSAEIVAGSLQALGRAKVVGERTFGKGSVQHLIRLTGQAAAIKLTVAYYRLPNGRIVHRTAANFASDSWGVIPDVEIELSDGEARQVREARQALDLAFLTPAPELDRTGRTPQPRPTALELPMDRQLLEAIRLFQSGATRPAAAVDNG